MSDSQIDDSSFLIAHDCARSIIATVRESFLILDQHLRVVEANRPFYEAFRVGPEETEGQLVYELGNRQWDIPGLRTLLQEILPGKSVLDNFEVNHEFKGLGHRTMLLNARKMHPERETILLAIEDVTEKRRTAGALSEGHSRATAILESITDAFFAMDGRWCFTYVNRQAERLLGQAPGDLIGKNLWEEYPGLDGSDFERVYRRAAAERTSSSVTSYYPDHDRWYEVHVYPASDGISIYFRDVSAGMRAQQDRDMLSAESERERRIYHAALSNTPDLVYVFDLDHRFIYANRRRWGGAGSRRDHAGRDRAEDRRREA
jgi:PAS domain S-box-containing protein